ncbi:hypothetical protein B0H14DRAFT_3865448 [Mycena olivaceomarginata]|nr:hypothetical protein B0H14DRAFT_3865448 [Mycena olivaceomarginata]
MNGLAFSVLLKTSPHGLTGIKPTVSNISASNPPPSSLPIIIGTLGKSSLINQIVNSTKLDVSSIENQWESFTAKVVTNPLPGVAKAYLIMGSDKRGTIFASNSECPRGTGGPMLQHHTVQHFRNTGWLFTRDAFGEVSCIFLNDEQRALQNWAAEQSTNGTGAALTGSPFNHFFYMYTKLFELLLRLKANHLWPPLLDWQFPLAGARVEGVVRPAIAAASKSAAANNPGHPGRAQPPRRLHVGLAFNLDFNLKVLESRAAAGLAAGSGRGGARRLDLDDADGVFVLSSESWPGKSSG